MAFIPGLVRPTQGRVIAGVCAGIARQTGVDANIVRLVAVAAVILGGASLWIYPLAWALMPDEGAAKAPIEDLFRQAKDWNSQRNLAQPPTDQQRTDVPTFNPYEEPRN
ncbi:PspC domain-containing protein [Luteococcus sanguinis]|uniref:PspC domain-containing protein n=1 Tax=Luteococcus sanguinis TaxID=174038 RepID=A0ABW1X113_9ACTN